MDRRPIRVKKICGYKNIHNPGQTSLGQYCNTHIFLSLLDSLLKKCILVHPKFSCSSPSPQPIQSWNSETNLDTRVQHCLWGEGRGWTCVNWKMPQKRKCSKTFVHDCRFAWAWPQLDLLQVDLSKSSWKWAKRASMHEVAQRPSERRSLKPAFSPE